jgi:hypothetical protein
VSKWFDDIFADIQQHGIVPDAMIFSALMSIWSPDIKRSWGYFQTMLDSVRHQPPHVLIVECVTCAVTAHMRAAWPIRAARSTTWRTT